jgi:hypothetical protein
VWDCGGCSRANSRLSWINTRYKPLCNEEAWRQRGIPQTRGPCIPSHQHSGHYQLERLGLDRCGNQDGTTSWIVHDAKRINDLTLPEG